MTEYQEAQKKLEQAKRQAQEQREKIALGRKRAEEARKRIDQERQKLPEPTQRLLRSGMFSGLEGRKRRQVISGVKGQIGERREEVDLFTRDIKRFEEEELKPFESRIKSREAELKEHKKHLDAIRLAEDVFYGAKDVRVFFFGSAPLAKKYYDKMVKRQGAISEKQLSGEQLSPDVSVSLDFETKDVGLPRKNIFDYGRKVGDVIRDPTRIIDYARDLSTGKPDYILDIHGGQAYLISDPPTPKPTEEITKESPTMGSQTFSLNLSTPRDLSITELTKDFRTVRDIDVSKLDRDLRNISQQTFLTTGSPIRRTPLTSLKPRRPPTPSSPMNFLRPTIKKEKKVKKKTKRDKDEDLFFGVSSSKKGKSKKKSIWGW